jgi:lysophospholipase L1-like esterase
MKNALIKIFCLLCLLQSIVVSAQGGYAFFNEIQAFQKEDSVHRPPKNAILFVGSSTFRLWPDIQQYFPSHKIINRGFGGSTLLDMLHYEQETIFKYNPKQIVIYCGDNDLASSDTVTSKIVYERFRQLFADIRSKLPKTSLVFVSIKPSPSRWRLKEKMIEANTLIKEFLAKQKKTAFVDTWSAMLNNEGKPMDDIFKEDKLHMNAKGYAIWQKIIEPYLK